MRNAMWVGGGITGMGEIPMLGTAVKGLTSIIRKIFHSGAVGFAYDPNDLTAEKINWRKNQLLNTDDFTYGSSGNYTAVKEADGWALTAIAQRSVGNSLLGIQYPVGAASDSNRIGTIVRSIEVKKGTGVFRFGAASANTALFVNAVTMTAIDPPSGLPYTITPVGSDWYRIETFYYGGGHSSSVLSNSFGWSTAKATSSTLDTTNQIGAVIRVRKPSFAFVPYETTNSIPYQAISDYSSDFIRAFPLHTLYQDAAGTVPVTAAGQPVGLLLDKSKGVVLGDEVVVGGNFESGLIGQMNTNTLSSGTLTLNTVSPISGTQDARVTVTAVDGLSPQIQFNRNVPRIIGALYEISFDYKVLSGSPFIAQIYNGSGTSGAGIRLSGSGKLTTRYRAAGLGPNVDLLYFSSSTFDMQIDNVSVKEIKGNHAFQTTSASRPILQQTPILGSELLVNVGFSNGTTYPFDSLTFSNGGFSAKTNTSKIGGIVSNTVFNVTAGVTYVIEFDLISSSDGRALSVRLVSDKSGAGSGGNSGVNASKIGKNTINYTPSVSGPFYLQFNNGGAAICDYRVENISMKEVTGYRTDQNYLAFDGADDFLQTANIDFTGTDDVTVIAASVHARDSASILIESGLNSSTSGFGLYAPHLNNTFRGQDYRGATRSVNTLSGSATQGEAYVLRTELTASEIKLAINGSVTTADSSRSGSYAIEPIYIGRRGGTSLSFSGNIYGLIGIGKLTTDDETKAIEKEFAKRTGASLNV